MKQCSKDELFGLAIKNVLLKNLLKEIIVMISITPRNIDGLISQLRTQKQD